MKKILSFLAVLFIGTALVSCLSDSNSDDSSTSYHVLTSAEQSAIMQKINRSYSGYLKFYNDSSKGDSVKTSLSFVNDSTATLSYPVSIISNYLTFSGMDSARVALQSAPNKDMVFMVYPPSYVTTDTWDSYFAKGNYPGLLFYPKNQTLQFTAGKHTYEVTFNANYITYEYSYYYPYLYYLNNCAYAYVLIESIKVDGGSLHYIYHPTRFDGR